MPSKKSWREKLADSKDLPKVEKITGEVVGKRDLPPALLAFSID